MAWLNINLNMNVTLRLEPSPLLVRLVLVPVPSPDPAPSTPGRPYITHKRQVIDQMTVRFGYTIEAPPPADPADVAVRRMVVAVDGTSTDTDVPMGQPFPEVVVDVGAEVEITIIDLDAAGNASPPSPELAFTAVDDIPPGAPGSPSVTSHRQIDEAVR